MSRQIWVSFSTVDYGVDPAEKLRLRAQIAGLEAPEDELVRHTYFVPLPLPASAGEAEFDRYARMISGHANALPRPEEIIDPQGRPDSYEFHDVYSWLFRDSLNDKTRQMMELMVEALMKHIEVSPSSSSLRKASDKARVVYDYWDRGDQGYLKSRFVTNSNPEPRFWLLVADTTDNRRALTDGGREWVATARGLMVRFNKFPTMDEERLILGLIQATDSKASDTSDQEGTDDGRPRLWFTVEPPLADYDKTWRPLELVEARMSRKLRWAIHWPQKGRPKVLVVLPPGMPEPQYIGQLRLELRGLVNHQQLPTDLVDRVRAGINDPTWNEPEKLYSVEGTPAREAERLSVGFIDDPKDRFLLGRFFETISHYQAPDDDFGFHAKELEKLTTMQTLELVLERWPHGDFGFEQYLARKYPRVYVRTEPEPPGISKDDVFWVGSPLPEEPDSQQETRLFYQARVGDGKYAFAHATHVHTSTIFLTQLNSRGAPTEEGVLQALTRTNGTGMPGIRPTAYDLERAHGRGLFQFLALSPRSIKGTSALVAEHRVAGFYTSDRAFLMGAYLHELSRYQDPSSDVHHPDLERLTPGESFELVAKHWDKGDRGFAKWLKQTYSKRSKRGKPTRSRKKKKMSRSAYTTEPITLADGSAGTVVTSSISGVSATFKDGVLVACRSVKS